MIRSRRSTGIAVATLVVATIAAGCARDQGGTGTSCAGGQADVVSAPQAQQGEEAAVCAAFADYRKALQDRNAQAALAVVPDSTIEYYDSLARLSGTGGPEEIGARSMIDRMMVAGLRTQYSTADLASMDGQRLFCASVETGRIDSPLPSDAELGTVRIAGDRAYIQIVADGTPTPVDFEFVHADGVWRFDVVAAHRVVNSVMEDGARQAGLTEDELIFDAVESVTGQQVDESIFARP